MKRDTYLTIGFALGFIGGIAVGKSPDPNGVVAWFGAGIAVVGFFMALFHDALGRA